MTSVDSGVETGNDSNDSSIVQHKSLTPSQSGDGNNVVATTACIQAEDATNTFPIGPLLPVSSVLPLSTLRLMEYLDYSGDHKTSTSGNTMGSFFCSPEVLEFRYPPMYECNTLSRNKELVKKRFTYDRKMRSLHATHRTHQYVTWVNIHGPFIERKMRLAAATNNTIMMSRLLSSGVSPNNYDEQGRTPLHLASCRGYTDMVRLLLEHGANPNMRDRIGNTPLHLAAVTCKISVVTLLLKAGTDVSSLDQHGYNPLQLAQTKLRMLHNCNGEDMKRVKEEVHNIVSMLLAYLQKQKDTRENVETLSTFCSRLSLSNTSHQVQDDIKDLLANLDALTITS